MIEYTGQKKSKKVIVSLHTVSGHLTSITIKLIRCYDQRPISILLDGGSTHCFFNPKVVHSNLGKVERHHPFRVKVADKKELLCDTWIPRMQWEMQGCKFEHNVHLLDIEPYDMISGVDWMREFSPMIFDFKELKLSFNKRGQRVTLQGNSENAVEVVEGCTGCPTENH